MVISDLYLAINLTQLPQANLTLNESILNQTGMNITNSTELNGTALNLSGLIRKKPTKFQAIISNKKKSYKIGESISFDLDFLDDESKKIAGGKFQAFLVASDGAEIEVALADGPNGKRFEIPSQNAFRPGYYYLKFVANFKKKVKLGAGNKALDDPANGAPPTPKPVAPTPEPAATGIPILTGSTLTAIPIILDEANATNQISPSPTEISSPIPSPMDAPASIASPTPTESIGAIPSPSPTGIIESTPFPSATPSPSEAPLHSAETLPSPTTVSLPPFGAKAANSPDAQSDLALFGPLAAGESLIEISDYGEEEGFALGLVNINTERSIYLPGEIANITIGVLNPDGSRADSATIDVQITSPTGAQYNFTTYPGIISDNYNGEYSLQYPVDEIGAYFIYARAQKPEVGIDSDFSDAFEARASRQFDIERREPTLIQLGLTPVTIEITPTSDVLNATAYEYLPSSFVFGPSSLDVTDLGNGYKQIKFPLGNLMAGQEKTIQYSYEPPPISPMLYLAGRMKIEYNSGNSFEEARNWTIGADDRFFIHDLTFYFNETYSAATPYPWDPAVLCANHTYNLSVGIVKGSTGTDVDNVSIQVSTGGPYASLPASNWVFWAGDMNPHDVSWTATTTSPTFGFSSTNFTIKPQATGSYNLRTYMQLRNGVVQFSSNIVSVTVRNCSNIEVANREMSVKDNSGISSILIPGSIGYIAMPLFNYNETNALNANVTLSILDGSTSKDWYMEEGASQSISIGISGYQHNTTPFFNESAVLWRVWVPDDADTSKTYTSQVLVKSPFQQNTYAKTFTLASEPVVIYTASDDYVGTTTEDTYEDFNMTIAVCNYGDVPITDAVIDLEFPSAYFTFIAATPANTSGDGSFARWSNIPIATSECFGAILSWGPIDFTGLDHSFTTTVSWAGNSKSVSEVRTISQSSAQADNTFPTVVFSGNNITYFPNASVNQNSTINVNTRLIFQGGSSAGDRDANMHIVRSELAHGFSKPYNFTSVLPRPGYPLGSVAEGWVIKMESLGQLQEGARLEFSFTTNVSATPDFQPGGKRYFFSARGSSQGETATGPPIRFKLDDNRFALVVQGPFLKTSRAYASNPAGPWISGFPSSFSCGTFNVSNAIFNKGNRVGYLYNFTEYYPSTITPQGFTTALFASGTGFARWGNAINLTADGTSGSLAYNYSFATPLGAQYNQQFQFNATNNTYFAQHKGRLYYVNFSCTDTPQYQNVSVTPSSSGFGFRKQFSVAVYSQFHNLTVNLSKSPDGLVNWTVLNTSNVTSNGVWNYANFSQAWRCDDIGSWYYNFTIFDNDGNLNTTTVSLGTTYTITKDTLQINLIAGNASLANRSSSNNDLLRVLVNDTNGTYLGNYALNLSVTYDGTNYGPSILNSTNSTGYLDYNFNATCSPTQYTSRPDQSWKVSLVGSSCYNDITSTIYALQIKGFLTNNVTNPSGSTNFTDPTEINAQGNVKDDCGNFISPVEDSSIITSFNFTANNTNKLCSGSSLGGGFYECPWASTEDKIGGYYNVTMNSTASKYYGDFKTKVGPDPAYLFYLTAKPKISAPLVIPSSDGWGVPVNYTVNYSSSVWNINTTARLSLRCPSCSPVVPSFEVTPASFCVGCLNKTALWTYNFTCAAGNSQVGTWFYTFSANTSEGQSASIAENSTTIEKDDVTFLHIRGNNSIVNRSGEQKVRFTLNISDTDRGLYAGTPAATITFNVSTNTTFNLTAGTNTTNSSGSVDFYFNATCDNSPGNQSWYAIVSSDTCYVDKLSARFNVSVYADFAFAISTLNGTGASYTIGQNVTLTLNTRDECGLFAANATPAFNITGLFNMTHCGGSDIVNYSNGTYSCTFNTSALAPGIYNITANATKEYFNYGTSLAGNAFQLFSPNNTAPVIISISEYPSPAGWGEQLNFSAIVQDSESQDVDLTLYYGNASTGPFSILNQSTCTTCTNSIVNYTVEYKFTCNDIGLKHFMFNGTDTQGSNGSSIISNWTVEKDNVTISYISGNGANVTRQNGTIILALRAYDDDNRTGATNANGTIWVTTNGASYDSGNFTAANASGNFSIIFKPSCSYNVGLQNWSGGVLSDACYSQRNSSQNYSFFVIGALNNNVTFPLGQNYTPGVNITLRGNVTDDCGIAVTGATVNFTVQNGGGPIACPIVYEEGSGSYNCSINTTALGGGVYRVFMGSAKLHYSNGSIQKTNAFKIATSPVLTNPLANLSSVYWGATIEFNVTVTDRDDNVTVSLWQKAPGASEYSFISSQVCTNCTNYNLSFSDSTHSACSDFGQWQFKFNATDTVNFTDQTTNNTFNLTQRNLTFQLQSGNSSVVHRVTNTSSLGVKFVDAVDSAQDIGTGVTGTLYVTTDGGAISYLSGGSNTSLNGIVRRAFDPTCSWQVGPQSWKIESAATSCYYSVNSTVYNISIITDAPNNTIVSPVSGTCYVPGASIILNSTVRDECSGIASATVSATVRQGASSSVCGSTTDLLTGNYSCVWNSAGRSYGLYNLTVNSSKQYYANASNTSLDSLRLAAVPELNDPRVNVGVDGWGVKRTFNITVRDPSGDTINVSLWVKPNNSNIWQFRGSQLCPSCSTYTNLTFVDETFTCGNYATNSSWDFMFNATTSLCTSLTNQSSVANFTMQQDDVNVIIGASASSVDRDGSPYGTLRLYVNDTDNASIVGVGVNGSFWITTNGSILDSGYFNQTNASGYLNYDFNPSCSYNARAQVWRGGVLNDACYKNKNSSDSFLDIIGQVHVSLLLPINQSTYNVTNNVTVRYNVTSECLAQEGFLNTSITNATLIHNQTLTNYLCSPTMNESNGYYNCTFDTSNKAQGNYSILLNASMPYYNSNVTLFSNRFYLRNILTNSTPPIVNLTQGGWGQSYQFNTTILDPEGESVTCQLFTNTSTQFTYRGNSTLPTGQGTCSVVVHNFTCADIRNNSGFMFQVINGEPSNTFNTTINATLNLTRDAINVTLGAGNASVVNRSGSNLTNLVLRLFDLDNQTYLIGSSNATIWITTNGALYDLGNSTQTNSSGHAPVSFNPTCSYSIGPQIWKGGILADACYFSQNSSDMVLTIQGELNANITSPLGSMISQGQNVTIRGNLTDDCGVVVTGANVNFSIRDGGSAFACSNVLEEGGGMYNCTFNTSALQGGTYMAFMNASKTNYFLAQTSKTNSFHISTPPYLSNPLSNLSWVYWGASILFNVTVWDEDDNATVRLWQKAPGASEYTLVSSQECNNCTNQTLTFSDSTHSACSDFGNWQFKFNATDNQSLTAQTENKTFALERRNLTATLSLGNNSVVHRVTNATTLSIRFRDFVDSTDLPDGVTGTLYVTADGSSNYIASGTNTSVNGLVIRSFDPTCSYIVGPQRWKVNVPQTSCYYEMNSSDYNLSIITDPFNNTIVSPVAGTCYSPGTQIIINSTIRDECSGVASAVVETFVKRQSSTFSCSSATDLATGNYSCTWDSTGRSYGLYNITVNSSKQYYQNASNTSVSSLRLAAVPELNDPRVNVGVDGWGVKRTFNITVFDPSGDTINVSLWVKPNNSLVWQFRGSQSCPSCSAGSGTNLTFVDEAFTCSNFVDNSTWDFMFNVTTGLCTGLANQSTVSNFTLQQDDVDVLVGASAFQINRDGTPSGALRLYVNDTDNASIVGTGVNGSFWVTTSGSVFDSGYFNQTNSSGYFNYDFNPSCSYIAGSHNWKGGVLNDICYKNKNSSANSLDIIGQVHVSLLLPINQSIYNVTNNVTVRYNVTSECLAQEGFLNTSITNATFIHNQTLANYLCSPTMNESDGYYNCTFDTSNKAQGNYSILLNASMPYYNSNVTLFSNRFYLKNVLTSAQNQSVNRKAGGWGLAYQFNVSVYDPEGEPVTCNLFVNTSGQFVYQGSSTLSTGSGNCTVTVGNFTCGDLRNNSQYFFQIVNGEPSNTFNATPNADLNLTADNLTVDFIYGQNSYVNRSLGNFTTLIMRLYDTDNQSYDPLVNATFWVTTNGVDYDLGNQTQTNSSGHARLDFNPSCGYGTGVAQWKVGSTNNCYLPVNTTASSLTILGSLSLNVTLPYGIEVIRGQNATINGSILTDCNVPVTDAMANFSATHNNTRQLYGCLGVSNFSSGNYSCTFNTTSMYAGAYNVTFNASKAFFNNETTLREYVASTSSFFIETYVNFTNVLANPNPGGYGETFYLSSNLTDEDNDTITIYSFVRQLTPALGEWQLVGSVIRQGQNQSINFSKTFGSSGDIGNWSVKFNATEDDAANSITSPEYNFTIERDDTRADHYLGNSTTVSRLGSNSSRFIVRVVDTDKPSINVASEEGRIWVTTNGSNYDAGIQVFTNSSGWIDSSAFNPDCTYGVGLQKWKAGILDTSSLFKPSNSTDFNVTITSEFLPALYAPLNLTFLRGVDNINFRANITDIGGCGLVNGSTVLMAPDTSYTCNAVNEGNGFYNCTAPNTTTAGWTYGFHNVTVNASKSYFSNASVTRAFAFYLASRPILSSPSVTPSSGGWGGQFNFSVTVTDLDDNNVTVYLFKRKSGNSTWVFLQTQSCSACSSTPLNFVQTFNNTDVGVSEYFFNATDQYGYTTNTSVSSFTIAKDTVTIEIGAGVNSVVNREGSQTTPLILRVYDQIRGEYVAGNVNGSYFITLNGQVFNTPQNTTTNSSGFLTLDFNPDCSFSSSIQRWRGGVQNDLYYSDSLTSNFSINVTGQLFVNLSTPVNGTTYNTSNLLALRTNVTTDCSAEGPLNASTVVFQLQSPSNATELCTPVSNEGNGNFNCTWDSSGKAPGLWSIRVNATNSTYNSNSSLFFERFTLVNAQPTFNNIGVTPSSGGWSRIFTYSVNVSDPDGNSVNCSLYTSVDNGTSWTLQGQNYTLANGNGTCIFNVSNYACGEIGTDNYFKFNIYDYQAGSVLNTQNTSNTYGPNMSTSNLTVSHFIGNETNVNRSIGAQLLSIRLFDSEKGAFLNGSVNGTVWVTTNGSLYDSGNATQTNSSGFLQAIFNPSCTYQPRKQLWKAGATDGCYQVLNSSEFNVSVFADIQNSLLTPNGANYPRGSNVTIRANITDECSVPLTDALVNLSYKRSSADYSCAPILNETTGAYNCTFNTTALPSRHYNVTMNASKPYHNFNSTTINNIFRIQTGPTLNVQFVNTSNEDGNTQDYGAPGETFNFNVSVTDEDNDLVTAYLFIRQGYSGDWTLVSTRTCSSNCNSTMLSIPKSNFACGDIAGWQFFWNASDENFTANLTPTNFTIEPKDVNFTYVAGDGDSIWRNGTNSSAFSLRLYDIDGSTFPGVGIVSGTRWVTTNGSSYDAGTGVTTLSNGYLNTSFDPSCTYAPGIQGWKIGSTSNSCYKSVNSTVYNITINTNLSISLARPLGVNYTRGSRVPVDF
ncbi:MAG: hypothetical protein AABX01_02740, partial [Candidatus Micrarchaeota archaeon]